MNIFVWALETVWETRKTTKSVLGEMKSQYFQIKIIDTNDFYFIDMYKALWETLKIQITQ